MNTRRWCACGCGRSVAHRRRGTKWATPTCRSDFRAGRTRHNSAGGGLQVSYRKTVSLVEEILLGRHPWKYWLESSYEAADRLVAEALPARQRQRLEKR